MRCSTPSKQFRGPLKYENHQMTRQPIMVFLSVADSLRLVTLSNGKSPGKGNMANEVKEVFLPQGSQAGHTLHGK